MSLTIHRTRRARHVRITVRYDGSVRVSAPLRVSVRFVEAFVASKQDWIAAAQAKLAASPRERVGNGSPKEYNALKEQARALVEERLSFFNRHYSHTWSRVSIRNPRSRWGSCSRRGTLSFSYRIALLPPALADYLVVHELCHLKYMHHGPRFWALVGETVPDWQACRRALRALL